MKTCIIWICKLVCAIEFFNRRNKENVRMVYRSFVWKAAGTLNNIAILIMQQIEMALKNGAIFQMFVPHFELIVNNFQYLYLIFSSL